MRNLRFYENDADFKANEIAAGGDGNSVMTSIPGVSNTWDLGKTYFNPHDEEKLTHTVTINYKTRGGETVLPSDTIEVKYFSGVEQEIVVTANKVEGYVLKEDKKTVIIPTDSVVNFIYSTPVDPSQPLTFKIISGGTIYWTATSSSFRKTIVYSKNGGEFWSSITSNTGASAPFISVNAGDVVQFMGYNTRYGEGSSHFNTFSGSTAKFEVEGNIMSLIKDTGFTTATTLASNYTFDRLFVACTGLTSAENLLLPATTLANNCYSSMFQGCTSLTTAPELPATTLTENCYYGMFWNCTSLTTAPELPATTLASYCYERMFCYCTSLIAAPSILPATTLAGYCYYYMFSECTSLTSVPKLPATALADSCYRYMFDGCTSLVTVPSTLLPATALTTSCYNSMFSGCTSLTTAPELPATTLAQSCYLCMFEYCTSLTKAPSILPATALTINCYFEMFHGCTSLTTAPELPATTLKNYCYYYMFADCTSLTTAPELPATTLTNYCYQYMFYGCTSLNYIKCLATNISASYCTTDWVRGVASTGTFVKNPNMTRWTTGNSGIPTDWTVQDA